MVAFHRGTNRDWRPGVALLINGKLTATGLDKHIASHLLNAAEVKVDVVLEARVKGQVARDVGAAGDARVCRGEVAGAMLDVARRCHADNGKEKKAVRCKPHHSAGAGKDVRERKGN